MKRTMYIAAVLVLALFLSSLALPMALAATTIFSDDFDDGDYNGWSTSGNVSISSYRKYSAPYSTRLKGDGTMWRTVSTQGYNDVTFAWYWAAQSLESADHCYAEVNTGSGWTTVDQLDNGDDDTVFRPGSWSGSGIDNNPNFQIRFRVTTAAADYCYIDDVVVSSGGGATPTDTPEPTDTPTEGPSPTPSNTPEPTNTPSGDALNVAVYISNGTNSNKILALLRAVDAMGHNVYGLGSNDVKLGRLNTTNFDVFVVGAGEEDSKAGYASLDGLNSTAAKDNIKAFLNAGGGWVGLGAGAWWPSANGGTFDIYGGWYDNSGTVGKKTISIVDSNFGSGSQQVWMDGDGGYLYKTPTSATVVAEDSSNEAVIVRDTYGSGRVILSSMALELRGDSTLDWTIWDNWEMGSSHSNSVGCWQLLGRMINWAATGNASAPSISTSNPNGGDVAVYGTHDPDGGAWSGLLPGVARSIEYAGYTPLTIRASDVNAGRLTTSNFGAVAFGGGYSYGYKLQMEDYEYRILDFAADGGGVYGICAGSFMLADDITWDGRNYDYYVDLFLGWDKGPLDGTLYEDTATYELLTVNVNDSVIGNLGDIDMMYYGGGYKTDLGASNATTVGTYEYSGGDDGTPDIIRFTYGSGNGHVLLTGSHPESRSGSNEDWIYWDNWVEGTNDPLNNSDNPWVFVDKAFDNWLMK
jgi:glutamine amidotransferase-like uncharacterized protein